MKRFLHKIIDCIRCFPGDVICFFVVTMLLCKDEPFEHDIKQENKRKEKIKKQLEEEYRTTLAKTHEPEEIEEQMCFAKDSISHKAAVLAKSSSPTLIEKMFDRFHDSLDRWPIYVCTAYVIIFAIVAILIFRNS